MSKEKQIENLASFLFHETKSYNTSWSEDCDKLAEDLYNAGYRKQSESEGEWETIPDSLSGFISYRHICSECKTFYKDISPRGHNYCHNCGAKMKGA